MPTALLEVSLVADRRRPSSAELSHHRHRVNATTSRSKTVTPGGGGLPSPINSSITIWATSLMFLSASSLVRTQVAPSFASSSGARARRPHRVRQPQERHMTA